MNPHVFMDLSIRGKSPKRIVIELYAGAVPKTAENFRALCTGEKGIGPNTGKPLHYKGCEFHYFCPHLAVVGGDFSKHDGTGGESIYGTTFPAERNNSWGFSERGVLMTVNQSPGATGSLFSICFTDSAFLRGSGAAVFGRIIEGMETVSELEQVERHARVVITDCGQLSQDYFVTKSDDKPQFEELTSLWKSYWLHHEKTCNPDKMSESHESNAETTELKNNWLVSNVNDREVKVNPVEMPKSHNWNVEQYLDFESDLRIADEKPSSYAHQHSDNTSRSRIIRIPSLRTIIASGQDHEKEYQSFESVRRDGHVKAQGVSKRTCTPVRKQGFALGRSVNLAKFNDYNELISELDELFEFNGELKNGNGNWLVMYTDDEGNLMLVGDDPWQEFCGMVRKMFIYTREEVHRMNPGTSNSRPNDGSCNIFCVPLAANLNASEGLQPQQYLDFDSDLRSEQLKMSKLVNNLASGQDQEKEYQGFQAVQPDGHVKAQVVSAGAVISESRESNAGKNWPVIVASAGAVIMAGVVSFGRG